MKHLILLLGIYVFGVTLAWSQEDWKLVKDKEGIQVYTRKTDVSNFVEFRGITFIDAQVSSFISVMQDAGNMTNWVYSLTKAQLLEMHSDTIMIYYAESKLPWPFDNRDAVYRDYFEWDAAKRTLYVHIDCLTEYLEENKGIVRIPYAKGYWKVQEIEKNKFKVIFQMIVDPGGSIPAWLVNAFVVDTPYETLQGLKEVIKEEKYQNVEFGFID